MSAPPTPLFGFVRFAMRRWRTRHVHCRGDTVRADLCVPCSTWRDVRPTGNVTCDMHGPPVWGRDCLVWGSLDLRCSVEAVRIDHTHVVLERTEKASACWQ